MPSREKLLEVIAIQTEVARSGLDLDGLVSVVVYRAMALADADGAVVEMSDGEDMVCRAAAGTAGASLGRRLHHGTSLSGRCLREGRAVHGHDALPGAQGASPAHPQAGLRSAVAVPLRHQGETVAVLTTMSSQSAHFSEQHVALLTLLADLVGAAMYFAIRYAPGALFHKATHDGLTDLPNRALFLDRLRSSLSQAVRDGQPLAVLMLDMNGLKPINDTHGHRAGDAALLEFSRRLTAGVRQSDTAARLGGDEFGVMLRPLAAAGGLEATMARLGQQLNGTFQLDGGRALVLSASMGAARFPEDGHDVHALLDLADQRMYSHKRGLQGAVPRHAAA